MSLFLVEQPVCDEGGCGTADGFPVDGAICIVFEGAVLHQFGVESTVAGVVDFFKKDAIESWAHRDTQVCGIDFHYGLGYAIQG